MEYLDIETPCEASPPAPARAKGAGWHPALVGADGRVSVVRGMRLASKEQAWASGHALAAALNETL